MYSAPADWCFIQLTGGSRRRHLRPAGAVPCPARCPCRVTVPCPCPARRPCRVLAASPCRVLPDVRAVPVPCPCPPRRPCLVTVPCHRAVSVPCPCPARRLCRVVAASPCRVRVRHRAVSPCRVRHRAVSPRAATDIDPSDSSPALVRAQGCVGHNGHPTPSSPPRARARERERERESAARAATVGDVIVQRALQALQQRGLGRARPCRAAAPMMGV